MPKRERIPRNGLTISQLAERTGYTPRTIVAWTSEPRETYEARAAQRREAIRAYKAANPNASMRAIATEFGCGVGTVHRALKNAQNA